MERWYVACYKPGKGNIYRAMAALSHINALAFCPQIRVYRPRADRPGQFKQFIEPLFPSYLFVSFDPEVVHTSRIEECPGISHLLRTAGCITSLCSAVVDEIMSLPLCKDSSARQTQKRRELTDKKNKKHQAKLDLLKQQVNEQLDVFLQEPDPDKRGALFFAFLTSQERKT